MTRLFILVAILSASLSMTARDTVPPDTIVIPDYIQFPGDEGFEPAMAEIDATIPILGLPEIDVERMYRFVADQNPDFDRKIAEAFYEIGHDYGVRGDIALCQAILETGWFAFTGGTAVTPDQHNYCGLGVTKLGMKGHSFESIDEGVTAHIQHLYAYASKHPLPSGHKVIDPRFKMVKRGTASTWADLNYRWAMNDKYGQHIILLYNRMAAFRF